MKQGCSKVKPEPVCMVIGCDKLALYLNPYSKNAGSKRGYCGEHKSLARPVALSESGMDYLARRFVPDGER